MLVAVMSDSHDNIANLERALARAAEAGCELVLHCGDLIAPFMVRKLGAFAGPVHAVFGNNDGDRFLCQKAAAAGAPNVTLHGEWAFVAAGGKTLGLTHYGLYARGMAALGECDAAFFGHTHEFAELRVNGRLVLNPGELLGMKGPPGFCLYNTEKDSFERVELGA
jgi:hypothetical protein